MSSVVARTLAALTTVAAAGSLAACADPGQHPEARTAAWPAARNAGTVTHHQTFRELGIDVAPPASAAARSALSAAAAYRLCATTLACPAGVGGPVITLGEVTTANGAPIDNPMQAGRARTKLAYVLRWDDVPCTPAGSIPGSTSKPRMDTCIWIGLVDATTGRPMGSGQTNARTG